MSVPLQIALGGSSLLLLCAVGILLHTAVDLRDFHHVSLKELDEWKVGTFCRERTASSIMKRRPGEK